MKKYIGDIPGDDIRLAVKNAIGIRPDVQRLFVGSDGTNIEFVIHKKDDKGIKQNVVVHKIPVKDPQDVREINSDDIMFDEFPICASIPKMKQCGLEGVTSVRGERYIEGTGISVFVPNASCPLPTID